MLLLGHAAVTAAAGLVLMVRPAAIPATVGLHLAPDALLLVYLLAAAEFAFAALSWFGARLSNPAGVQMVMLVCVTLHASSAVLEAVVWHSRPTPVLLANIVVRVIVVVAFLALLPARDTGRFPLLPYNER